MCGLAGKPIAACECLGATCGADLRLHLEKRAIASADAPAAAAAAVHFRHGSRLTLRCKAHLFFTAGIMSAQQLYHMVQMDSFQACLDAQKPYFPPT